MHYIQTRILTSLAKAETQSFSEVNTFDIPAENLAYHLKKLLSLKLISKADSEYKLTDKGVRLAAELNIADDQSFQRAGLSAICILFDKSTDKYLLVKRKKVPFRGMHTFVAGKVQYGEKTLAAVKRIVRSEVKIEMLRAEFKTFFRQQVKDKQDNLIKDNSFCVFECSRFSSHGSTTQLAEPVWLTLAEISQLDTRAYDVDYIVQNIISPSQPAPFLEEQFSVSAY